MSWAFIIALLYLTIQFLCKADSKFDAVDEAGLLVEATEAAGGVDNIIFFLEGFAGHGLIKFVEDLLDLVGVCITVQLVIGTAKHSQNRVGIAAEVCLLGNFLCLQGS